MSEIDFGDGLRLCARCHDQDALDAICTSCKRELIAYYDGQIGWRAAWEREQAEADRCANCHDAAHIFERAIADLH